MTGIGSQKSIAARLIGCGVSRVRVDPARIADVQEAITAADVNMLISSGIIWAAPKKGVSSARRVHKMMQKKKGRMRGHGSKKGKIKGAKKRKWMAQIRALRDQLRKLKGDGRINGADFRKMYVVSKSGFFRSRAHLMVHLERNGMLKEPSKKSSKEN